MYGAPSIKLPKLPTYDRLLTRILKLEETGVRILEVDYLDESTIEKAVTAYGDNPLDMLINVAGLQPKP
jgi:short-subunit dehydrogenase